MINVSASYFRFYVKQFLDDDDNYDMAYDEPSAQDLGDVYGDINDDLELQVVENPYYGCEVETSSNNSRVTSTNVPSMEVITSRQNDYYEI